MTFNIKFYKMRIKSLNKEGSIDGKSKLPTLKYTGKSESAVPIVSESELQTVTAEPWVKFQIKGYN